METHARAWVVPQDLFKTNAHLTKIQIMEDEGFTEVQNEVIDKVEKLLSEHFDAFVLAVTAFDINDKREHCTGGCHVGGIVAALGLLHHYDAKLKGQIARETA